MYIVTIHLLTLGQKAFVEWNPVDSVKTVFSVMNENFKPFSFFSSSQKKRKLQIVSPRCSARNGR